MIIQSDALSFLRMLPDNSVDLIVTDPPYPTLEKHRKVGTTTRLTTAWFPVLQFEWFPAWFDECYRVLKPNSHFYLMCDQESMFEFKPMGEAAGFKFWKPIIWDKMAKGMGYHYRARHEMILFFEKGKRKLNNLGVPDVLQHKRVRGGYPTQKPDSLYMELIEQSSAPGDVVLDTFAGSGTIIRACRELDRHPLACDIC